MLASVITATVVSFVIAALLLGFGRKDAEDQQPAVEQAPAGEAPAEAGSTALATRAINGSDVRKLVIACDAGMGSSVMVAGAMKKKLAPQGVEVVHSPVNEVPADTELIMCQAGLVERARKMAPDAVIVPFQQFIGDPAFARVEQAIKNGETIE